MAISSARTCVASNWCARSSVRGFVEDTSALAERSPDQWQQDAFGQVDAWLRGLGNKVRCPTWTHKLDSATMRDLPLSHRRFISVGATNQEDIVK